MKRKLILAVGTAALAIALSACGSKGDSSPSPSASSSAGGSASPSASAATAAANGESIYKANCVSCHGADLSGKLGPNLQKVGAKLDKDKIVAKIQNGGGGMPGFKSKMKDDEIQALGDWLASKK